MEAQGGEMSSDRSEGWEAIAGQFIARRSRVGAALVRTWAREHLNAGATILDVGCGSGIPIAQGLIDDGYRVAGVDASPSLLAAFARNFPDMPAQCAAAQDSMFFHRTFPAIVSVGLIFLLEAEDQRHVLGKLAAALEPGGRLLFSAPGEPCRWRDTLTDRTSISLGTAAYTRLLDTAGLRLAGCHVDEGGNNYFDAMKPCGPASVRR